ncbi:hypothetical protein DRW41_12165 [Neobacillus piezotolerans]|uniref:LPXTG cell wall anchor domain-containing protein n=1 Tax=Neobacillus piezotolerans TaxID=2259171 RepID=A0A3D8GRU1_9BACI|nr:hypothetical protein [Neobacillus piezotolerans]RDU36796.1 hypothetical protein DRW41_12165 [Neobacillus piezotolerans]
MLKKILVIFGLLFLFISNQAISPTHTGSSQPIALAASSGGETHKPASEKSVEAPSPIHGYILPGIAGILIIGGLASYWLVFRKKVV